MILTLGILLLKLSIVGFITSRFSNERLQEEVRAQRVKAPAGYLLMIVYLKLTCLMFVTFLFATIWFIFFNSGPSHWMENTYFQKQKGEHSINS